MICIFMNYNIYMIYDINMLRSWAFREETATPDVRSPSLSFDGEETPDSVEAGQSGFACAVSTPINSARVTAVLNVD